MKYAAIELARMARLQLEGALAVMKSDSEREYNNTDSLREEAIIELSAAIRSCEIATGLLLTFYDVP